MTPYQWVIPGLAALLLSCESSAVDGEARAGDDAPPPELITQEVADQQAAETITEDNADEEFDRLAQEIDSDQ